MVLKPLELNEKFRTLRNNIAGIIKQHETESAKRCDVKVTVAQIKKTKNLNKSYECESFRVCYLRQRNQLLVVI